MHIAALSLSTARCCHHPLVCRGPTGNAEAKYQEISDTEKPHFPLGEQSVNDKVGAASANNRHGWWRKLGVVTAQGSLGAFMQLLFTCGVRAYLLATHPSTTACCFPSLPAVPRHARGSLAAEQHPRGPEGGQRAHQVPGAASLGACCNKSGDKEMDAHVCACHRLAAWAA